MATEGFQCFYMETRDYSATAAFWASMGFEVVFETDHNSGQWAHPGGGPYVFVNQQNDDRVLETHPILGVADSTGFVPDLKPEFARQFTPQHWAVTEAIIRDPDGRDVSLQAPLPPDADSIDADEHHRNKYGDD